MFRKIFCLIIFTVILQKGNSQQNLVLNPGFESFDSCLSILGNFGVVNDWHHPLTYSTPDYFNSCNTIPLSTGVPGNLFGFQQPHSGQAYAGIMTSYFHPLALLRNYREYIGGQLSSPLVAGNKYCIKFYVSAGDSCLYVSDNLGIYLSALQVQDTLWISNPIIPLQYTPQIENTIFNLSDRINWTEVSWEYIATGGELFFALGNFRDTLATTTTATGWVNPFSPNYISYLYIDDVSIVQCDSISSVHSLQNISDKPVLFSESGAIQIMSDTDLINKIIIRNVHGQIVYKNLKIREKKFTIDSSILNAGIYFAEIMTSQKKLHVLKFISF